MRALKLAVGAACAAAIFAVVAVGTAGASVTPSFSATDVTSCGGVSTVTVTLNAQNPPPVQQAADIVLLVDDSGSIGASVFANQVIPSLTGFVGWASPSAIGNHIGVVKFSTGATDVTTGLLGSASTLTAAVAGMHYDAGFTYTLAGLQAAYAMLTGSTARPGAPKVIVVETDGVPDPATTQNPTAYAHTLVTTDGVEIFAVGVGSDVNQADLTAIAGGVSSRVVSISDYAGLESTLESELQEAVPAATGLSYSATAGSDWQVTGVTASDGSATFTPGGVSWSLDQVNSADPKTVTITYTEQHVGTTDSSADPLASAATLSYTDDAGNAQSVDYSGQTVAVSGCNRPPTANAGPDQTVDLNGSHTASVSLDGTGSSDPDGDALTYSWSENGTQIASGPTPTVSLGLGSHDITLTVGDGEYTATDDVVVDVVDPTPPVVTASVTGPQHNGWYTGTAVVSFTVTDAESDVTSESSDCAGAAVSTDTTGVTFSCTATSAGGTTGPVTATVQRDATPPTITFSGNHGTYHLGDTVAITCTAADATSGLATPANCGGINAPAWSLGAVHSLTGTATDNAGNTTTSSTSWTVVVDAAGLCSLIKQWDDNAGNANSLCVKIDKGHMQPFWNELAAQRGKHIAADKADAILALSKQL